MTITEASIQILRERGEPLSAAEIAREIQQRQLFAFKVAQPRQVVLAALKRHSVNSHSCAPAKQRCFREPEPGQFELASP